jgi:hypothetical protein
MAFLLVGLLASTAAVIMTGSVASAAPTSPGSPSASSSKSPAPADVPGAITWAVQPSTAKGPNGRSSFTYNELKPRTVVNDYVGVTNYSKQAVTFNLSASDAYVTSTGSMDLLPASQKSVDLGAWITLKKTTITIPAGARVNEPFSIIVPQNATPGDHTAGLIASVSVTGPSGKAGKVTVDRRLGVPVLLRVAGQLAPALSVESLTTKFSGSFNPFSGGNATVSYTIHNTGNVRLDVNQVVSITGLFGPMATARPTALTELLPGQSHRVTQHLTGVFPAGPLTTHVKLLPTEVAGLPPTSPPPAQSSRAVGFWAFPLAQLLLVLVVIAAAVGIWWLLRWRGGRHDRALAAAVEQARRETAQQLAGTGRWDSGDNSLGRPRHGADSE